MINILFCALRVCIAFLFVALSLAHALSDGGGDGGILAYKLSSSVATMTCKPIKTTKLPAFESDCNAKPRNCLSTVPTQYDNVTSRTRTLKINNFVCYQDARSFVR